MTTTEKPKHEFPCDYVIKIISDPHPNFPDEALAIISNATTIKQHKVTPSKKDKYISLSVNMHLQAEKVLADIYEQLKQISYIKMIM